MPFGLDAFFERAYTFGVRCLISVFRKFGGLIAFVASLLLSGRILLDGISGLQRTEEEIVLRFEGAAQLDIFGLGFGFFAIVVAVAQMGLFAFFRIVVGRNYSRICVLVASVSFIIATIVFYQDYSRELGLWNSA